MPRLIIFSVEEKQALTFVFVVFIIKVDIPMSSTAIQSLIEASPGSLDHGWEVGWSLASASSGTHSLTDAAQSLVI